MTTMTTHNSTQPGTINNSSSTNGAKTLPTHELFDVQERPGQRPFWNKVGSAFANKDGSHSVLVYQPGIPAPKRMQLRAIDREKRPLKDGADAKRFPTHELFVVVENEGARNDWNRVGVGYANKDGSLSLVIDDGVRGGPTARFQLRLRRDRPTKPDAQSDVNSDVTSAPQSDAQASSSATGKQPSTLVRKRQAGTSET